MDQETLIRGRARLAARAATAALVLGSTLALTLLAAAQAEAAETRASLCSAGSSPAEAGRLGRALDTAISAHGGTVGVAFLDLASGVTCDVRGSRHFDSASVAKTAILATLLFQTQHRHTSMSASERTLATAMITRSDNNAASALWQRIGGASGLRRFLDAAGMTSTVPGTGGMWGLTQITAQDQVRLLCLLATDNGVLTPASRAYELGLMRRVVAGQRWGAPTGAPRGEVVAVKNGWLPLASGGWHVNTTGVGLGHRSYVMAILSEGNPSMGYGVATVSSVAKAINRNAF
jgi:beta-lactamase class A